MAKRRKIPDAIRQHVAERAHYRCSYCRAPAQVGIPMVVDHIIPLSAGGHSEIENLCLSCYRCNEFKGPRISAEDPVTQQTVTVFNPNTQTWTEHFSWSKDGLRMIGLTAVGRATIQVLRLNADWLVQGRQIWKLVGLQPPLD